MGFRITRNINFEKRTVKSLGKLQKELEKQMTLHAAKLKKNTDAGKGYHDKKLKKYKPSTKKDRKRLGLQVSPTNLTRSRAMLRAIDSKTNKTLSGTMKGSVFIRSLTTKNFRRKGQTNTVTKAKNVLKLGFRFFGITKKDVNKISRALQQTFKKEW